MPRLALIAVAQTKRIHLTQSLFMIFFAHNWLLGACCSWRDMIAIRAKHIMKAQSILLRISQHVLNHRFVFVLIYIYIYYSTTYIICCTVLKGYFYSFFFVPTVARGLNKRYAFTFYPKVLF